MKRRYEVILTDYHWDKCWGVFDTLKRRWVMRDTIKRHCVTKAKELNKEKGE